MQRAMLGFTYSSHDKKCFMEHLRRFSMHVLPRLNLLFIPDPKNNMFFNYKHLQKCYDVMIQTSPFLPSFTFYMTKQAASAYLHEHETVLLCHFKRGHFPSTPGLHLQMQFLGKRHLLCLDVASSDCHIHVFNECQGLKRQLRVGQRFRVLDPCKHLQ